MARSTSNPRRAASFSSAGEPRRLTAGACAFLFLFIAPLVYLIHWPLLGIPYFWDEAGQFIPAALDLLHGGTWVARSTVPNIHPPGVMLYLAAAWKVAGYSPAATRAAMLLLGAFALLAGFLLARELSGGQSPRAAWCALALLLVSPLVFAQSMLAQLDAPAMLFTVLALLLFLWDRIALSAAACVILVLVKETGLVVPLVFFLWLARERRWRDAAAFVAPAAVLGLWIAVLYRHTGHWAGNQGFVEYNVLLPLHPLRLLVALLRRFYYLFIAGFHWIGTAAIVLAWKKTAIFRRRSWAIAGTLVLAHVLLVSALGGAVLERYLLPVLPVVYAAMAAGLSVCKAPARVVWAAALILGVAAGNFLNPPYPFPYEDNLAFADFVRLQQRAAGYLLAACPGVRVETVWPLTLELSRPDLGFVPRRIPVQPLRNLSPQTLRALDWRQVQALAAFSRNWTPPLSILQFRPVEALWRRLYGGVRGASRREVAALVPFPAAAHFARRGQWVDIYLNPAVCRPGGAAAISQTARAPDRSHFTKEAF